MVIGVDIRWIMNENGDDYSQFIAEALRRLVMEHPEHQFYFLSDEAQSPFISYPNVQHLVVRPVANTLWKYWYAIKLPGILKKIKADVLLSLSGVCSFKTRVPQCFVISDPAWLTQKKFHRFFHRRYLPGYLKKAQAIITHSAAVKQQVMNCCQINGNKISLMPLAVHKTLQPLGWDEKDAIKERYTEGKEYFISSSVIFSKQELVDLLKAFSFFKKRQQSGMKLVLAGEILPHKKSVEELLSTYKYRNDVLLISEEKENLIAAAYAMIYSSTFKTHGMPVLQAIHCNVPVLCVQEAVVEEITGENALWFRKGAVNELAEQMMYIYKDEKERSRLIEKGRDVIQKYNIERSVAKLSEVITHIITRP